MTLRCRILRLGSRLHVIPLHMRVIAMTVCIRLDFGGGEKCYSVMAYGVSENPKKNSCRDQMVSDSLIP